MVPRVEEVTIFCNKCNKSRELQREGGNELNNFKCPYCNTIWEFDLTETGCKPLINNNSKNTGKTGNRKPTHVTVRPPLTRRR